MIDVLNGIGAVLLAILGAYFLFVVAILGFAALIIGFVWFTVLRSFKDPNMEWTIQEEREGEWKIKGRRKT